MLAQLRIFLSKSPTKIGIKVKRWAWTFQLHAAALFGEDS
jgi:hypothetical protein